MMQADQILRIQFESGLADLIHEVSKKHDIGESNGIRPGLRKFLDEKLKRHAPAVNVNRISFKDAD